MLETKLDETSLASARYFPADVPPWDGEEGSVERITTRYDATEAEWVREQDRMSLEQAVLEVAVVTGLPADHACAALLYSTAHTGGESPFEMGDPEPVYIEAHPLLEIRANEAQAKQRAYELSKLLPHGEAAVITPDGEDIALYKGGALYSSATGEQLTPAG